MIENILVTGSAGFIGFHVCINLIKKGFNVIGVDNLNDYYDVKLKKARLDEIFQFLKEKELSSFTFVKCDLEDKNNLDLIFKEHKSKSYKLSSQGVRYSINNPSKYINSNLVGFAKYLQVL